MPDEKQWGYEPIGDLICPNEWPNYYQTGKFQSPINILIHDCANRRTDHSTRSTCCAGAACKQHTRSAASAPDQQQQRQRAQALQPAIRRLAGGAGDHDKTNGDSSLVSDLRRTHLNSIGEDDHHQRSSSVSSNESPASSSSSSPVQEDSNSSGGGGDPYDEYEFSKMKRSAAAAAACCLATANAGAMARNHRASSAASAPASSSGQSTRFCFSNRKLFLGYPRYMSNVQLCNTGHSWQITIPPELGAHTLLSGPPLGDREYRLAQVHAHWGEHCGHGSEHQINGRSYAAEIHFVHWNCSNFRSLDEASKHKHGLAVLGVLVTALEGDQNKNKHLEKIIGPLKQVKQPGSSVELPSKLDLKKLFPANRWSYAAYEGSLTTPPLSEVVDWIVFLNPIVCSTNQIEQFHQIECESSSSSAAAAGINNNKSPTNDDGGKNLMRKNFRPVQPTNNRLVSIWNHPTTN